MAWRDGEEHPLTRETLAALLANEIAAIRIERFATAKECRRFARAIRHVGLNFYSYEPPVGYIGMTQFEFKKKSRAEYLAAVPAAYRHQRQVLARAWNPLERLIERLGAVWPGAVSIAAEAGGERYFAGIIRQLSNGVGLHADFAPYYAPGYAVARVAAELSWNLYVEELSAGGEVSIFDAPWSPAIASGAIAENFPLPEDLIAGAASITCRPTAGDVIIFNSRNPHRVAAGEVAHGRQRLQMGSFVGLMPEGDLVLWS